MNYFTLVFFLVVSFFGPVLGAVGGSKKAPPPLKPRPKLELLETEEEKQGATYARDEDFVKAAEEYEEYMDKRPQGWKLKKGMPAIDEEIDRKWVSLEELSKEVKPQDTLNALKANDPALWRSLCIKIKDPNFYEWASTNGVGTFKRNAMISGCENFTRDLEQVRTREAKQGPKMPGDGRENAGLQSFLDKKRQEREKKAKLEQQKAAALKIQNVVRMHLARTKHSDGLQAQKEKIHQEAEEQKRLEEERIRTQEEDERLAEEQKRDDNSRRRMNAINTMEGQLREKRERIQQQAKAEEEGEAATKIQSAFRGFSQRKKFKEMKAAEEKRQRQEAARKAEEERKRVKEEQRRAEEEQRRAKEAATLNAQIEKAAAELEKVKEQAKAEHQKNIVTAENKLKEAREYYDNLSAAILSFKMDLEEDSSLKRQLGDLGFFIKDYKKATPEVFIEALSDYTANFDAMKKFDMQRKNQVILQLKQAYTLYGQTKKALENAQAEIEALIRENLEEHSP